MITYSIHVPLEQPLAERFLGQIKQPIGHQYAEERALPVDQWRQDPVEPVQLISGLQLLAHSIAVHDITYGYAMGEGQIRGDRGKVACSLFDGAKQQRYLYREQRVFVLGTVECRYSLKDLLAQG